MCYPAIALHMYVTCQQHTVSYLIAVPIFYFFANSETDKTFFLVRSAEQIFFRKKIFVIEEERKDRNQSVSPQRLRGRGT